MADAAELAGIVGTWVAVALAVIALAGVLPVYLLYRASNTERNIALSDVDDPHHLYISPGVALWRGKPFSWTLGIPDFTNSPCIEDLRLKFHRNAIQKEHSLTGWVNLANLLRAYGAPGPRTGALEYNRRESYLPVHRGWLLLIGINGRYTRDKVYGVARGQPIESEMVDFGKHPSSISGSTGMLGPMPSRQGDLIDAKICFRLHSAKQLKSLHSEDIHIKLQVMLFLGLLPGRKGALYDLRKPTIVARGAHGLHVVPQTNLPQSGPPGPPGPPEQPKKEARTIWKLTSSDSEELGPDRRRILHDLNVKVPYVYKIATDQDERESENYNELRPSSSGRHSFYSIEVSQQGKPTAWMCKSDLSRLLNAFFGLPTSPYGFLCGPGLFDEDGLFSQLFPETLSKIIECELQTVDRLNLSDSDQEALREAMLDIWNADPDDKSWSRGRMAAFHELAKRLCTTCKADSPTLRILMILYALDPSFAALIRKPCENSKDAVARLSLDLEKKVVRTTASTGLSAREWYFEFYKITHSNQLYGTALEVAFPYVKMACLLAEVRIAMWRMMIPAKHLSTFYNGLDSIVHITSRTVPPKSIPQINYNRYAR
ncbi:hypothetical protein FOXG_22195 [Fusarium oxysporum f. sp. lycopersici 4287]|uniref:Uncharacterized protein n=1 Tax=Fusarium oxysporum f. sp. lycopersici (strain 4287 / CBS 123668 / FGSC 9935 / NRRL 34936) TaxID=426428 RepID=A0A0J9W467_FUSO4|nr:hypothetical protein FOXG_22060 [Fusarium oxysporum f. sp. lycopersici 4287]XP_018256383.1 uncharacterized protein FOXG_22195 [Fusarium oxysporum f. sp. lycopersici 4287]KAJ9419871.1 hypothetical protein QL093DRAFT_1461976 [Fusarium oxysporum]KNB17824.1 hypothetical protein FOXG_22060 [Fusarium oxysporum f. sp. lycopersici 4287]KNB18338.1 hypothetical protein FOXG_22195 [Fusarium oxysporum f. sp. lycopersici 4287]